MNKDRYKKILSKSKGLMAAAEKADHNDTFAQVTSYVTAPVLFCYIRNMLENAQKAGIKKIYFLARDGYVMKIIADEIIKSDSIDIESRYLYCSRYVLKNALYYLCDSSDELEKAGFFGRCAYQSAVNTLSRAGFSDSERKKIYGDINFCGDENAIMGNYEFDSFCNKLKSCNILYSMLKDKSKPAYEKLLAYFEQEGMFSNTPFALCDTGWLGSIQSALTMLVKDKVKCTIKGYYFGLFRNADYDSFIPYLFSGKDAHKVVPRFCNNLFECFCSAPHGMTIGYEKTDGVYLPVLKNQREDMRMLAQKQTEIISQFVKNACKEKAETLSLKAVKKLLFAVMYKPCHDEAEILGAFPFCDDATELNITPLAEKCGSSSLKPLLFPIRLMNKAKGKSIYPEKGIFWLYGTIALSDSGAKWMYRISVRLWEMLRLLRDNRG